MWAGSLDCFLYFSYVFDQNEGWLVTRSISPSSGPILLIEIWLAEVNPQNQNLTVKIESRFSKL